MQQRFQKLLSCSAWALVVFMPLQLLQEFDVGDSPGAQTKLHNGRNSSSATRVLTLHNCQAVGSGHSQLFLLAGSLVLSSCLLSAKALQKECPTWRRCLLRRAAWERSRRGGPKPSEPAPLQPALLSLVDPLVVGHRVVRQLIRQEPQRYLPLCRLQQGSTHEAWVGIGCKRSRAAPTHSAAAGHNVPCSPAPNRCHG